MKLPDACPNCWGAHGEIKRAEANCHYCEGSGEVHYLLSSGRYRTRLQIAYRILTDRLWAKALIGFSWLTTDSQMIRAELGTASISLGPFSADEIEFFKAGFFFVARNGLRVAA